jgi:hypothetical protein
MKQKSGRCHCGADVPLSQLRAHVRTCGITAGHDAEERENAGGGANLSALRPLNSFVEPPLSDRIAAQNRREEDELRRAMQDSLRLYYDEQDTRQGEVQRQSDYEDFEQQLEAHPMQRPDAAPVPVPVSAPAPAAAAPPPPPPRQQSSPRQQPSPWQQQQQQQQRPQQSSPPLQPQPQSQPPRPSLQQQQKQPRQRRVYKDLNQSASPRPQTKKPDGPAWNRPAVAAATPAAASPAATGEDMRTIMAREAEAQRQREKARKPRW